MYVCKYVVYTKTSKSAVKIFASNLAIILDISTNATRHYDQ